MRIFMKENFFKGCITALVTPFKKDRSIDYEALKKLIEFQIKSKVDALVIAGTTGESPSLSSDEKKEFFGRSVEFANGRIPIIAGTGSNNTEDTVKNTKMAKEAGSDAVLIVTPYYNKPTQNGLFEHYSRIAESVNFPQIIYNVPGRTSVNITAETQLKLAEKYKNIIGTKEASGNLIQIMDIINHSPKGFNVMSGDDAITLPLISIGIKGCVSVISNYAPKEYSDMIRFALNNQIAIAQKLHYRFLELMNLDFIESSPGPVKYILSYMGYIKEIYRLPITKINNVNKQKIRTALKRAGLV
jgi:4-hydroxy-tetrahydrodipicolinate synthase